MSFRIILRRDGFGGTGTCILNLLISLFMNGMGSVSSTFFCVGWIRLILSLDYNFLLLFLQMLSLDELPIDFSHISRFLLLKIVRISCLQLNLCTMECFDELGTAVKYWLNTRLAAAQYNIHNIKVLNKYEKCLNV